MPRKGPVPPREIPPDPVYGSVLIQKLINRTMIGGKKSKAEKIVYKALEIASERLGGVDPRELIEKVIDNVKPIVETRSRRVGGATYQVPVEVPERRQISLAIRWLVLAARARGPRNMVDKLADELVDAYNGRGGAVAKRDEVHRIAESNKAFAHLRWGRR